MVRLYLYTGRVGDAQQVPHKWSYNQQGDLIIAQNPFFKKKVVELPDELVRALESSFVGIRESGVNELGKYLHSRDREMVELAISFLKQMKEDDSRRISSLAEKLLFEFSQVRSQTIKATSSKMIEPEPEIAEASNDELISSPETAAEIEPLSMPKTRAAQPVAGLVEAGTQQNIFFISLSLSLILY